LFPYKTVFWLAVLAVAGYYILPHSTPIILALLTAIILEPVVRAMQRGLRLKRAGAVTLTFTGFLLLLGGLFYFLITRMVIEVVELVQRFPVFIKNTIGSLQEWGITLQEYYEQLPSEYAQAINTAFSSTLKGVNELATILANGLVGFLTGLPNLMVVSVVYIVALFLFSLDLPNLVVRFLGLFDDETRDKIRLVLNKLNRAIIGFLQAQILISFLTYDLVLVGLWILGVPYALAVALIIVVVDVLPVLGTGAVIVPWSIYTFLQDNQTLSIGLLILYVVIIVFRRIVEPKILGQSLGISALATLVSMYLGFMVLGFFGLILGPALVILYQAFRDAGFFRIRIHL
jgi:sporulation integral membrane protein YtvI